MGQGTGCPPPIEGPAVGVHPVAVVAGAADGHQSIEAHLILQMRRRSGTDGSPFILVIESECLWDYLAMVRVENVDAGRRVVEGIPVEDMGIQVLVIDPKQQVVLGRARLSLPASWLSMTTPRESSSVR